MKIFIMDTIKLLDGISGDAVHKWEISRNLSKLGHEVHVMTYTGMRLDGAVAHSMKDKRKYKYKFSFKIMHLIIILKIINTYNFDILYTRNVSFGLLGLLVRKITKSKVVLELNGLFSEDWKSEEKSDNINKIRSIIWSGLEIFTAKKANAIISVTSEIKDILIKKGVREDKITVIPNAANIDLFKPIDDDISINELRYQYGISENDHVIIFVGNLMRWHGVKYLIKSAPLILKTVPNATFLIIGDGCIKKELSNLAEKIGISNKIIFAGRIPYEKVPLYINLSDVCVAPSIRARNERTGCSPLKIYEYLACGKPVVASNVGGIGDILRDSNSGISIAPEDPNEIAKALIKLLKNKGLREKMGKNGRELVVNNYSWKNAAIRTSDVFERLLNQ